MCSSDSCPALQTAAGWRWSVLADVLGSYERQPVERGSFDAIRAIADVLGAGSHGSAVRIIEFGIQVKLVDSLAVCRIFNQAFRSQIVLTNLSSDHDPCIDFINGKLT